jgi:hypothetical protein
VVSIGSHVIWLGGRDFRGIRYSAFTSSGYIQRGGIVRNAMPLFCTETYDGKTKRALCAYVKQK